MRRFIEALKTLDSQVEGCGINVEIVLDDWTLKQIDKRLTDDLAYDQWRYNPFETRLPTIDRALILRNIKLTATSELKVSEMEKEIEHLKSCLPEEPF